MRALFGCLAVVLGAISIALAARYGYKGADTLIDGVISAVVFGAIALCAFLFDAAAVRLWFMGHRIGSVAIGLIAAAALVVTFTNSLGAIAGRADAVQAQRQSTTDTRTDNRSELKRLQSALASLGTFAPADDAAVKAARRAADTATASRKAECDKRGPLCKQWERDETAAAAKLAEVTAAKATTDRANRLEADIAKVKTSLQFPTPEAVGHANPLGNALAMIIGSGADVLTAWQQAIVAAVFELCLVGVMVIFELLGQGRQRTGSQAAVAAIAMVQEPSQDREAAVGAPAVAALPPTRKPAWKTAKRGGNGGSVKAFGRDHLFPADDGERVDIKALMQTYRAWCADKRAAPVDLNAFLDEIEQLCSKLGIRIEMGDDQRVYCHGVKIEAPSAAGVH
jgi:hypothetical protein